MVEGRTHLDDVGGDDLVPRQRARQREKFAGGEAPDLRCACPGCERGIKDVDVDGQIDRGISCSLAHSAHHLFHSEPVEVAGANYGEPESGVVDQILGVVERPADAYVGRGVRKQQALLGSTPKHRAMRPVRAEVAVPGVQVSIEVHDGEGPVVTGHRTQGGQCHRMVSADCDQTAAVTHQVTCVIGDLCQCLVDVEGVARHVACVDDLQHSEGCDLHVRVVGRAQVPRRLSDRGGSETSTWAVGDAAVERCAEDGDVEVADLVDAGQAGKGRGSGEARHATSVDRPDDVCGIHGAPRVRPARRAGGTLAAAGSVSGRARQCPVRS